MIESNAEAHTSLILAALVRIHKLAQLGADAPRSSDAVEACVLIEKWCEALLTDFAFEDMENPASAEVNESEELKDE